MSAALALVGPRAVPATIEHVGATAAELVYRSWWWDDAVEFAVDLGAAAGVKHRVMFVVGFGWVVAPA